MAVLGDTRINSTRRENDIAYYLWKDARYRAKKKNLPFNIEVSDISIPEKCPIFGRSLSVSRGRASEWSPSLDRIIPEMGYTKGNIVVVSHRVNCIKTNATVDELKAIADFYKRNINTLLGLKT